MDCSDCEDRSMVPEKIFDRISHFSVEENNTVTGWFGFFSSKPKPQPKAATETTMAENEIGENRVVR